MSKVNGHASRIKNEQAMAAKVHLNRPKPEMKAFLECASNAVAQCHNARLKRWSRICDKDDLYQDSAMRLLRTNSADCDTNTARAAISFQTLDQSRRLSAKVRDVRKVASLQVIEYDAPQESQDQEEVDNRDEMEAIRRRLECALSFIPAKLAMFVRLRFFDGKSVKEIAKELGTTIDSVDAYVRRGIRELKQYADDILEGAFE